MPTLAERLRALGPDVLRRLRRGIEKESLRVRKDGALADTPHPPALGSALTHPHITTDFSEAQIELITGVHGSIGDCIAELTEIHQYVYRHLGDEMLWCSSMPCGLPADDVIPVGRYGHSNVGTAKTVYRIGLGHRYGRRMQAISGIHYNFSLPEDAWPLLHRIDGTLDGDLEFQNNAYFALIRNFRRRSWLLLYLFGASPAVCRSFVAGRKHHLEELHGDTLYRPWATSLRMGRLGYQSDAQGSLAVSYNGLASYARSLSDAMTIPYPPYEAIGIRVRDEYRQLNTALLQIENEFYGTIRPKRVIRPGERPLHALGERGVEYVEVRCMDVDPFLPVGIDENTMRFLDVFLLHCLLDQSPPDTAEEIAALGRNQLRVASGGREPGLKLERGGGEVLLVEWGEALLRQSESIATALDDAHGGHAYRQTVDGARAALRDPDTVPSARILTALGRDHGPSYVSFIKAQSLHHLATFRNLPLDPAREALFAEQAKNSVAEQQRIEAADTMSFEAYRQKYISQV